MSLDDTVGTSVPVSPELFNRWYQDTEPSHEDEVIELRDGLPR